MLSPFDASPRKPMISLIQRVSQARVSVAGETIAAIDAGLLALVGVEHADGEHQVRRMCERLLGYRVFADGDGRMNRSLADSGGQLLLVPQFTLAADTRKGMRPGFASAADPDHGEALFRQLVDTAQSAHTGVENGRFGTHMEVGLVNDGPVTFWLSARE